MSRWPSVADLLATVHPEQRQALERAAADLGRPHSVLPAPLAAAPEQKVASVQQVAAGPVMNKTETRYLQRLQAEGHRPRFAALTLCLTSFAGRRVRYTPDFFVFTASGFELHEVKGAHVFEDGALKFKFAVEEWGELYTFVWAQWKGGQWSVRRYERRIAG